MSLSRNSKMDDVWFTVAARACASNYLPSRTQDKVIAFSSFLTSSIYSTRHLHKRRHSCEKQLPVCLNTVVSHNHNHSQSCIFPALSKFSPQASPWQACPAIVGSSDPINNDARSIIVASSVAKGKVMDYAVEKCIDADGNTRCSKPFVVTKSSCYNLEWKTEGALTHTTAEVRDAGSDELVFYRDTNGEWTPEKGEVSSATSSRSLLSSSTATQTRETDTGL
jgi:hypothetical protein